jgi:hypothetical protein
LDIIGIGLSALEMLCGTVLPTRPSWGDDGLKGSWRNLFLAWEKFRDEVTRWHTQIFHVFHSGVDSAPLYRQLSQERVVERVTDHLERLRTLLLACTRRTEDRRIQQLLTVLAESIDERSTTSLAAMVDALSNPAVALACTTAAPPVAVASVAAVPYGVAPTTARAGATSAAAAGLPAARSFVPTLAECSRIPSAAVVNKEPVAAQVLPRRVPSHLGGS